MSLVMSDEFHGTTKNLKNFIPNLLKRLMAVYIEIPCMGRILALGRGRHLVAIYYSKDDVPYGYMVYMISSDVMQ